MSAPLTNLERYAIILASQSPRRKQLLKDLGLIFETRTRDIDESYPSEMPGEDVAGFLAAKKADVWLAEMAPNEMIITADTVVCYKHHVLGKPETRDEAIAMIEVLSGRTHQVYTGVCVVTKTKKEIFSVCTDVTFATLTPSEIAFYVDNYRPYDKAGAYGIQEWIGYIAVESISGSYFNVMGLPVQKLYTVLKQF